jgi:hypothetical protein
MNCNHHKMDAGDPRWQAAWDELTASDDDMCMDWQGQVCPLCFLELRDKMRDAKLRCRVAQKKVVALGAELAKERSRRKMLGETVSAVIDTLEMVTHRDFRREAIAAAKANNRWKIIEDGEITDEVYDKIISVVLPNVITQMLCKKES